MKYYKPFLISLMVILFACSMLQAEETQMNKLNTIITYKNKLDYDWEITLTKSFDHSIIFISSSPIMEKVYAGLLNVVFVAMKPLDYHEYKEILDKGICPADYLNEHSFTYFVITDNSEISMAIKRLKKGDKIRIKGYNTNIKLYKNNTETDMSYFDDLKTFVYINSLEIL